MSQGCWHELQVGCVEAVPGASSPEPGMYVTRVCVSPAWTTFRRIAGLLLYAYMVLKGERVVAVTIHCYIARVALFASAAPSALALHLQL